MKAWCLVPGYVGTPPGSGRASTTQDLGNHLATLCPVTSTGWNNPKKGAGEAGCNVTSANTTNRRCCRSSDFGLPDFWASRGFGAGPNQASPADTEPRACFSWLWGSARGRRGLFGARMLLWPSLAKRTAGCYQAAITASFEANPG